MNERTEIAKAVMVALMRETNVYHEDAVATVAAKAVAYAKDRK